MSEEHASRRELKDEVIDRYERRDIDFERMLTELFVRDVGLRPMASAKTNQ